MQKPIELLNSILSRTQPHETIRLSMQEARAIAALGARELGSLAEVISSVGVVRALESNGLFSRKVIVSAADG
jgi:hypothetical protein